MWAALRDVAHDQVTILPDGRAGESVARAQIRAAAVELFAQTGFFGTSMRAIASEVGMQISSLYHHFPGKQDLLFDIMQHTMQQLDAEVSAAVEAVTPATPSARLSALVEAHVRYHGSHRDAALISDSELPALDANNRRAIIALRDRYEARLRQILRDGQDTGEFKVRNVSVATFAVLSMCNGVAQWFDPERMLTLDEVAAEYAQLAQHGLVEPAGVSLAQA